MTTPGSVIKEYQTSPFDLFYDLRGKEFTIIEDIKKGKDLRETKELNKWKKMDIFYFIKVECGLFQKDFKMNSIEMRNLFLAIPASVTDYIGTVIEVDKDSKAFKYKGSVSQDMNGEPLSKVSTYNSSQKEPITHPDNSASQTDMFLKKMTDDMGNLNKVGIAITPEVMLKIADSITPGDAMGLISAAKTKGLIFEQAGVFKVT